MRRYSFNGISVEVTTAEFPQGPQDLFHEFRQDFPEEAFGETLGEFQGGNPE